MFKWSSYLDALHHSMDFFENALGDANSFSMCGLGCFGFPQSFQNGIRNRAAWDFIIEILGHLVTRKGQQPDDDRYLAVFDAPQKALEDGYIENRLGQCELGAGFNFVIETL